MRVFGDGTGFSGDGGFFKDRGARVEEFRRNRKVGDTVRGKLLGFEANGLARALIDGREMLARVQTGATPGQILYFLVVALHPDIVLKELPAPQARTRNPGAMARELGTLRGAFEAFLARAPFVREPDPSPDILARRKPFLLWLAETPEAARLYGEIQALCREASALLAPAGLGRYHYAPWILPAAAGFEALTRRLRPAPKSSGEKGRRAPVLWDARCRFSLPGIGMVGLSILFSKPEARYRLALENPRAASEVVPLFSKPRLGGTRIVPELLGVSPLGPEGRTDLLSLALSRSRQRFTEVSLQV